MRIAVPIVFALVLAAPIYAGQASDFYHKARKLEKAGNIIQAYTLYAEAAQLEPGNATYRAKAAALEGKAVYRQQVQNNAAAAAARAASSAAAAAAAAPAANSSAATPAADPAGSPSAATPATGPAGSPSAATPDAGPAGSPSAATPATGLVAAAAAAATPGAATPAAKPDQTAGAGAASPDSASSNAASPDKPEFEPEPYYTSITARELAQARQALSPAQLKLPTGRFDFHFNFDAKELFEKLAERCGLQTVFDSEYTTTPQKIRFDVNDVDCRAALHAAESATSSFIATLSSKLVLISKDTPQKRQANEQTMSVAIPVNTVLTAQDLTEIAQAVKQVTGIEKMSWNAASNEIVIRDRVSRVQVARALVQQLTAYRGSVVFDLRFLQLSDTEMLSYGVNLTNSFSILWAGSQQLATSGAPLNAVIKALGQGWQGFAITALQASIVANLSQSKARTVLETQIRSVNGMPATLHVGDKYPILTSGYFGATSSSTSANNGSAYTPPPSFTYQDLGVSVKVLPVIGNEDLITLDLETEYQLLAGQAVNGIPILANRKFTTRITVHNDEWSLVGGLMDETNSKSISGVAGAARIPLLGWLFKTENRNKDRDHIVIIIKPHLTGEVPASRETAPMPVGTETRPLSPI